MIRYTWLPIQDAHTVTILPILRLAKSALNWLWIAKISIVGYLDLHRLRIPKLHGSLSMLTKMDDGYVIEVRSDSLRFKATTRWGFPYQQVNSWWLVFLLIALTWACGLFFLVKNCTALDKNLFHAACKAHNMVPVQSRESVYTIP